MLCKTHTLVFLWYVGEVGAFCEDQHSGESAVFLNSAVLLLCIIGCNKHASLHEHCYPALFYAVTQALDPFDALSGTLPSSKPSTSPQFTGPEVREV